MMEVALWAADSASIDRKEFVLSFCGGPGSSRQRANALHSLTVVVIIMGVLLVVVVAGCRMSRTLCRSRGVWERQDRSCRSPCHLPVLGGPRGWVDQWGRGGGAGGRDGWLSAVAHRTTKEISDGCSSPYQVHSVPVNHMNCSEYSMIKWQHDHHQDLPLAKPCCWSAYRLADHTFKTWRWLISKFITLISIFIVVLCILCSGLSFYIYWEGNRYGFRHDLGCFIMMVVEALLRAWG